MNKKSFNTWLHNVVEQCLQITAVCYHLSVIFLMPFLVPLLFLYVVSRNEFEFEE